MTDFEQNTSSPTEEEMSRAKQMLDAMWSRVSNTVVEASKLTAEVKELRDELGRLKEESREALHALQEQVDKQTRQNQWLDEQLTNVRQQRDVAQREREEERSKHGETERALHAARQSNEQMSEQLNGTLLALKSTEKERDDAQLRVMELEESLKAANERLVGFKEAAQRAFGLIEEVKKTGPEVPPTENVEAQPEAPTEAPKPQEAPYEYWRG